MSARILIVDDEPDLIAILDYNLRQEGHETLRAECGQDALTYLDADPPPDLVLLDWMMPDISGPEICRRIRENPDTRHVPILMLTARGEEVDRVVGFEIGVDDYVSKPFSVRELMLRVRALLRRSKAPSRIHAERIAFGILAVDPSAHRVSVDGDEVSLTALEFRLLYTLLDRRGRVQTRSTLLQDVWEHNVDVTTRTVDTHVKRLREKLGLAGAYVETIRGVGYRFRENAGEDGA